jgi:membrane associated rhomboid family serine protease
MDTPIRRADGAPQADEWALVLAAAGIPHRLAPDDRGVLLIVPADEVARAEAALDGYDRENVTGRGGVTSLEAASLFDSATLGSGVALALVAFFAWVGPPGAGNLWFERGAASAARIVGGEPWRIVTALTLHLDTVHIASNAVATAVLLTAVVQRLGPGLGVALTLLAGAAANALGALVHDAHHVAVGASTATFGAIGILAGLRISSPPPIRTMRTKPWTVLAAALLLLAMLGTSKGSDVTGHALGLGCGLALGLIAGIVLRRPPGALAQWALALGAVMTVIGCWFLAFSSPLG